MTTRPSWQSVFEHEASTSIGDIAVAPSNPDIVWVGTGEANLFRASMSGVGVYKSSDGARTFSHSGLTDTQKFAVMKVMNENTCDCGCDKGTLANCVHTDPNCPNSRSPSVAVAA